MSPDAESLRFILGLKLRRLRAEGGESLTGLARRAGLSVSYLSEIEKGKKYPKPDKLLRLAEALGVPFDELVSLRMGEELGPLRDMLGSSFLRDFPFAFFGVEPEDLFGLVSGAPERTAALVRTFLDVSKTYDLQVEHFLLAALRSYQQMHLNHFEELEREAEAFRDAAGWPGGEPPTAETLEALLAERYGVGIDRRAISGHPVLGTFRSVFVAGPPPRLLVNDRLLPVQKAFIFAREIGYRHLGLGARATTSSWIKVESFDQLLNNFRASYFAGALLLDRRALGAELESLFARPEWSAEALLGAMRRFDATPEMFFYRLTELLPHRFGLREIFFLRFSSPAPGDKVALTKVFNLSSVPVPHGVGLHEHYCRRWPALRLLRRAGRGGGRPAAPTVAVQRSYFLEEGEEFFVLSLARPLALDETTASSVSLGFRLDDAFRARVRFWDDPAVPRVEVNLTCERCPLAPADCADRVAPPRLHERAATRARQERALADLIAEGK